MIIYKVINILNGKIYIGKTSKSLEERKKSHINSSKILNSYFYKALRKYGYENFEWFVICQYFCITEKELSEYEKYYIKLYASNNKHIGYNLTKGGEGITGYKHTAETIKKLKKSHKNISEETRNKMRLAKKNMTTETKIKISASKKGKSPWNKGIPSSQKTKEKIGKASKGRIWSKESRERSSKSHKGLILSKEHCENISKGKKGIIFSDAHKEKLSKSHKGKKAWNRGIPHSEETKYKLKKAWEKRKLNILNLNI